MKKIISGLLAASVAVCSFTSVFAAPQYSDKGTVTVEGDIKSDNSKKKATVNKSSKLNITSLFSWNAVNSQRASEKNIIVTSNAGRIEEGNDHPYIPSEVSLRIVNPDADNRSKFTVGEENLDNSGNISSFEYFTLTVSGEGGIVFKADNIPAETTELTIPLGVFNYDNDTEKSVYFDENKYTISLQENSKLDRSDVIEYAYPTKWDWYIDVKQQPDYAYGLPTPVPAISEAVETALPTASPGAIETVAPSPQATPDAAPSTTPRVRPTTTPRVRTTNSPRPTASPKSSAKSSTSASATPSPKNNPKTGDTAPIGLLSMLGILSLAAIAVIQIKKNRD